MESTHQTKNENDSKQTFVKRSGTTDLGKTYEDLMVADLVLQFITDNSIEDFQVWSNDKAFGVFDDVIVITKSQNETQENYAIQLKHVTKNKQMSLSSLTEAKGPFSIQKYFHSFQNFNQTLSNYNLVLMTNLKFNLHSSLKIQLQIGDKAKDVEIIKSDVAKIFDKGGLECYRFQIVNESEKSKEYDDFFQHFFLYTNQMNVNDLETSILKKIDKVFPSGDGISDKFLKFFSKWSVREGIKTKLHKTMMEEIVALLFLHPLIIPISEGKVNENGKLLQEAVSKFSVTIFSKKSVANVRRLWGDAIKEVDVKEIHILQKKFQIGEKVDKLGDKDWTKLLWIMNKCPLIVEEHPLVYLAIDLCKHKRFIIVGDTVKDDVSYFRTLSQLQDDILNDICLNFKCSLPGNISNLKTLIKEDEFRYILTDDLAQMVDSPYEIQEEKEEIPISYISRLVSKNMITTEYLNTIDDDELVVISDVSEENAKFLKIFNTSSLDEYLKSHEKDPIPNHQKILVSAQSCSFEKFNSLCMTQDRKTCHHFKFSEEHLEWVASKKGSDVSKLEQHHLEGHFIEESKLWPTNFDNNLHVIAGDPGIGKSWLLKNLKNYVFSKMLTIIFSSQDMIRICSFQKPGFDHLADFFVDLKYPNCRELDRCLLKMLIRQRQVIYFWDGLDEIDSDQNIKTIVGIVEMLSNEGIIQWSTCRRHLKNYLEDKFSVCSKTVAQLSEDQQIEYIRRRLQPICTDEDYLEDVILKIRKNVVLIKHEDILSIPLQVFMLTELCLRDKEKYSKLLNDIFTLTDLYRYFVEEKFNFFYRSKVNVDALYTNQLKKAQNSYIKHLEKAALSAILEESFLEELNVDCDDFLEDTEQDGDCFGFVSEVKGDTTKKAIFVHISFAEYFVASYFSRRKISKLKEILFKERYSNVRYFFDMLLAKNSPAHIAVLHRNLQDLKNFGDKIYCKDEGGRSVLHLVSSYGERYPVLDFQERDNHYVLDNENPVKQENLKYLEMLEYLLQKFDPNETDDIFQMTALEYARKNDCLLNIALMLKSITSCQLQDLNLNCSILYYCVRLGHHRFIGSVIKYKDIRIRKVGTLLHLAAKHGHVKVVEELLTSGIDPDVVNESGKTPLMVASIHGNREIAKLLIDFGADTNLISKYGESALVLACFYGHEEVAKLLIQSEANIDSFHADINSPLISASVNGHDEIVNLLLGSGMDINATTQGRTALASASASGQDKVVEVFIKYKADIDVMDKYGQTPLLSAAENGHVKVVDILIKAGVSVNTRNQDYDTALSLASRNGHHKVVRLLLSSGTDINNINKTGHSPLALASEGNHDKVVETLLHHGADIDIFDLEQETPLSLAAQNGHDRIVKILLRSGAVINPSNKMGYTPLHLASMNGHEKTVRVLLKHNADVNSPTPHGQTPLHCVSSVGGNTETALVLITAEAEVDARDADGRTSLTEACIWGNYDMVRLLLTCGADVNVFDEDGLSPLGAAFHNNHEEIFDLLVEHGADLNNIVDVSSTPLYSFCERGNLACVEKLLRNGVNTEVVMYNGWRAIHIACFKGYAEIVRLLLESGTRIDVLTDTEDTPLDLALENDHPSVVQLLIDYMEDNLPLDRR